MLRKKHSDEMTDPTVISLYKAFCYDLVTYLDPRFEDHGTFAPMVEHDGQAFPLPIGTLQEEDVRPWVEIASLVDHPVILARLHDLLWEYKYKPRPDEHARAAIRGYLAIRNSNLHPLHQAECLVRASEIARSINDSHLTGETKKAGTAFISELLNTDDPRPGVLVPLLSMACDLVPDDDAELDQLLERAALSMRGAPYSFPTVVELQVRRTSDLEEIRALRTAIVDSFIEQADATDGLGQLTFLETALEAAVAYGLGDQANRIRLRIQEFSDGDLDLKSIAADIQIPPDLLQRDLRRIVGSDTWQGALTRFGVWGPLSGDPGKNIEQVDELMRDFPIQFLMTKVILGSDNEVIRRVSSPEEHRDMALIEHEARAVAFGSLLLSFGLDAIVQEYKPLRFPTVKRYFTTDLIGAELAHGAALALRHYINGDYESATTVALPRIEAVIREIARITGIYIYREPRRGEPGVARPLGDLLRALKGHFDESWRRFLIIALTEAAGVNLRNRALHGRIPTFSKSEAALALHILCFLRDLQMVIREVASDPFDPLRE